jgi:glutaconyl-CoA/methylmalonyl-CoA decarboxylase subunit delta
MNITELLTQFANPETLKLLSFSDKLVAGLVTTLLGMGITFIALVILQVLISWMDRLINRSVDQPAQALAPPLPAAQVALTPAITDGDELVAVISAVIAAKLKTSGDNIVIRNIEKIEDRSPVWNRAGIIEQMNNRF